jgi:hypothetical protein
MCFGGTDMGFWKETKSSISSSNWCTRWRNATGTRSLYSCRRMLNLWVVVRCYERQEVHSGGKCTDNVHLFVLKMVFINWWRGHVKDWNWERILEGCVADVRAIRGSHRELVTHEFDWLKRDEAKGDWIFDVTRYFLDDCVPMFRLPP